MLRTQSSNLGDVMAHRARRHPEDQEQQAQGQSFGQAHTPLIRRNGPRSTLFGRCALHRTTLLVLAGTLAACPARSSEPSAPPAPKAEPPQDGVRYDCADLLPAVDACKETTPDWIATLHHLGNAFFEPDAQGPSAKTCAAAHRALDTAKATDPSTLTLEERIVAQNGALRLYGPQNCDRHQPGLAAKAKRAVAHLAPSTEALKGMGSAPFSDLELWLGPPQGWRDRQTKDDLLMHDQHEFFTRGFRPVETENVRAIFGQMVALDPSGAGHLTPIVSRIELRRSKRAGAAACVGKLVPQRLRCANARLLPIDFAELTENQFIAKTGPGRVGCDRCHQNPDFVANLEPLSDPQHLQRRRSAFLKALGTLR